MIKAIISLILISGLSLGVLWLYQNSGNISFDALGYHVETSFALSVVFLLIAFILFALILRISFSIFNLPQTFKKMISTCYKVDIPLKLEELLVAIYNHDYLKAVKALNKLKGELPVNLINLLASEVAMLKEDVDEIKLAFLDLAKHNATRIAGLEGLISVAKEEGNWDDVINYCDELSKIHKSEWLLTTYIHAFIIGDRWERLISFLENSKLSSLLAKDTKKQLLAVAKYKLANNAFLTWDYRTAYNYALESYKKVKEFTPNLVLLAKINAANKNYEEAIKFLKIVWQVEPSFIAADSLLAIGANYNEEKFFKIVKNIASYNPSHYESNLIVAKAAIDIRNFEEASEAIGAALEGEPKFRACLMMAEYCQKTHGSTKEVIEWLKRAINSELDILHQLYFWDFTNMNITKNPSNNCFPVAKV